VRVTYISVAAPYLKIYWDMLNVTFYSMLLSQFFFILIYDLLKSPSIPLIRRWLETSNERMISDYSNYIERMRKEGFLTNLNYYQYWVFGCMH